MDRREFVGNLVGSTIVLNLPLIENNNKENPKKLPVVQFENGKISNSDEVLAKIPWKISEVISAAIQRKCHCWVHEADTFIGYGIPPNRIWGEVELLDVWHDNGFRYVSLSILPESIKYPANLNVMSLYGFEKVRWQDQGIKVKG